MSTFSPCQVHSIPGFLHEIEMLFCADKYKWRQYFWKMPMNEYRCHNWSTLVEPGQHPAVAVVPRGPLCGRSGSFCHQSSSPLPPTMHCIPYFYPQGALHFTVHWARLGHGGKFMALIWVAIFNLFSLSWELFCVNDICIGQMLTPAAATRQSRAPQNCGLWPVTLKQVTFTIQIAVQ